MLFTRARTAAIVGCLVFFAGFFIYVGLQSGTTSRSSILAGCLHPAAAFTYGTLAFTEYEDAQIGITSNTWNVSNTYAITFQDTINMMFIDAIWLGALSWYLDKIWPSEFGTHKPWYFIFLPSYWKPCLLSICWCFSSSNQPTYEEFDKADESETGNSLVEEVSAVLNSQKASKVCVDIRRLFKEFSTNTGKKVAVDNLSLTMYSGQITALLGRYMSNCFDFRLWKFSGHNGAGKSTTIAMLTGLIPPDGGTAYIEGLDLRTDMEEIRRNLGVCPQHDIVSQ